MWTEELVAQAKIVIHHFPEGTEKKYGTPHAGQSVFQPRLELDPS
jgi:hypothetical protein